MPIVVARRRTAISIPALMKPIRQVIIANSGGLVLQLDVLLNRADLSMSGIQTRRFSAQADSTAADSTRIVLFPVPMRSRNGLQ